MQSIANNTQTEFKDRSNNKHLVIALHCSAGKPANWNALQNSLPSQFELLAPEISTYVPEKMRDRELFSLDHETQELIEFIDTSTQKIHLVGHSYGGALALYIANQRRNGIASLSLYEPCVFHLISRESQEGELALNQIQMLAASMTRDVAVGNKVRAMESFVDFWNGAETWASIPSEKRLRLAEYAQKLLLEFQAAFSDTTAPLGYRAIDCPIQIIYGNQTPLPTLYIANALTSLLQCDSVALTEAGHMGPLTHSTQVAELITDHIRNSLVSTESSGVSESVAA